MLRKTPSLNCHSCSGRKKGIFCDLQGADLDTLDSEKNVNFYKKGQTLFLSGNPPFGLYCVHKGQVKISKVNSEGKETIVRIVGEGGVLGHRSLFSDSPYAASATVMAESTICFLSKQTIKDLVQSNPKLSFNIISKVSQEMGAAEDKLASMARKSVRERFAETLLLLQENFGTKEKSGSVRLDLKLTREEIAAMVGAASENITRLITEFKNEGILSQDGKFLLIEDRNALEKEASLGY